ncbi:hypothetical protein BN11_690005 [Nostocoides australiense Ben110]|uniref:Uncharacterized protein n=1 Tax=Nostocoides australiense Ben110 TaxID=1193182 RepID=W6K2P1_9MICO|nr:hypothetical protein BN11_690005 [Tetrasphaera australiensis Ben110]
MAQPAARKDVGETPPCAAGNLPWGDPSVLARRADLADALWRDSAMLAQLSGAGGR